MLKDSKMSRRDGADQELEEAIRTAGFREENEAHAGIEMAKRQFGDIKGLRYPCSTLRSFFIRSNCCEIIKTEMVNDASFFLSTTNG